MSDGDGSDSGEEPFPKRLFRGAFHTLLVLGCTGAGKTSVQNALVGAPHNGQPELAEMGTSRTSVSLKVMRHLRLAMDCNDLIRRRHAPLDRDHPLSCNLVAFLEMRAVSCSTPRQWHECATQQPIRSTSPASLSARASHADVQALDVVMVDMFRGPGQPPISELTPNGTRDSATGPVAHGHAPSDVVPRLPSDSPAPPERSVDDTTDADKSRNATDALIRKYIRPSESYLDKLRDVADVLGLTDLVH